MNAHKGHALFNTVWNYMFNVKQKR